MGSMLSPENALGMTNTQGSPLADLFLLALDDFGET
jgi:hypothetical protein